MPLRSVSHFAAIGYPQPNPDELFSMLQLAASLGRKMPVTGGYYIQCTSVTGSELWFQFDENRRLLGVNPHYSGKSRLPVRLVERLRGQNGFESVFYAWCAPGKGDDGQGVYPFLFMCPDVLNYPHLLIPGAAVAQITCFAHEITVYESEAYNAARDQQFRMASKSFIPTGVFNIQPDRPAPQPMAGIVGHVVRSERCKIEYSGATFIAIELSTYGGVYDVVVESALLDEPPSPGSVVTGEFWLSGRFISYEEVKTPVSDKPGKRVHELRFKTNLVQWCRLGLGGEYLVTGAITSVISLIHLMMNPRSSEWFALLMSLCLGLVGFVLFHNPWIRRHRKITVYEHGFSRVRSRRAAPEIVRWDEIKKIYLVPGSRSKVMLDLQDGRQFVFKWGLDPEMDVFWRYLDEDTRKRLLPECLEHISRGQGVWFDRIGISSLGIHRTKDDVLDVLAFVDIEQVEISKKRLRITKRGKWGPWVNLPLGPISNLSVFLAAVEYLRQIIKENSK